LTPTGGRIKMVEEYLDGEAFFATYGDGIADIDLAGLQSFHLGHGKTATMTVARPKSRFGVVDIESTGVVSSFREKPREKDWINIGYFIFEPEIFGHLTLESTLEDQPLRNLVGAGQVGAFEHSGFWQPMDNPREAQDLKEIWDTGSAPWKIW